MNKISSTKLKIIRLILLSFIFQISISGSLKAHSDIPPSILFGGITVKFDKTAKKLIEEDIQSLTSNKKFWDEKLDRAILFFPIVENILEKEDIPVDFKYLGFQESSFKPEVVSSSNEVGFWQFTTETAQQLGLRVDKDIDERKNISSSTYAAARYIKNNNPQPNHWIAALHAYFQKKSGVKVPVTSFDAKEVTFSGRTDRSILRFFAYKIAFETDIERYKPLNSMTLIESEYGTGETFAQISTELGIPERDLRIYNRWVTNDKIPNDKNYFLTLPVELSIISLVRSKLSVTASPEESAPNVPAEEFPVLKKFDATTDNANQNAFYEINGLPGIGAKEGDNAKSIAKAGSLKLPKFLRYNDMSLAMPIIPKNVYYLATKNKRAATSFHTVKKGDNWQRISQQYGIRLVNLLKFNRTISKNFPLEPGQIVWLDKKRPKNTPIEVVPPKPGTTPTIDPILAAVQATQQQTTNENLPSSAQSTKYIEPVSAEQSGISNENVKVEPATSGATAKIDVPVTESKKTPISEKLIATKSQDNKAIFKPTQEPKATPAKPAPASKPKTPDSLFSNPTETTDKMLAKTQPAVVDNTLPTVREKVATEVTESANTFHIVKSGQTFFSISRMHNLTVNQLLALNHYTKLVNLSVGQKLIVKKQPAISQAPKVIVKETATPKDVETPKDIAATKEIAAPKNIVPEKTVNTEQQQSSPKPAYRIHVVAPGETVFRVSVNYKVSIQEIQKLNNLSGFNIVVGQKLKLPQK